MPGATRLYVLYMTRRQVSVATLRTQLAGVLRDVEKGNQVLVTRNGRAVARVVPVEDEEARLRAIGWHPATRRPGKVRPVALSGKPSLTEMILSERD